MASTDNDNNRVLMGWYSLLRVKTSTGEYGSGGHGQPGGHHSILDLLTVTLVSVLPLGTLVLTGQAAKDLAGPSTNISVIFAALAALLSGCCYAELRSRVHRAKTNPYNYLYHCGGELLAFIAGWCLIFHHLSCVAATSRAISTNIDCLLDFTFYNLTMKNVGPIKFLDSHLDFISFFLVLVVMLLVAVGINWTKNKTVNMVFSSGLLLGLLFIMVAAIHRLDFHNWKTPELFFTGGPTGVFSAAAVLNYAFCGYAVTFQSTDFTSREMRKPVMMAQALVFALMFLLLIGITSCETLLSLPSTWISEVPLAESYTNSGMHWIKYIISVLAVLALIPVSVSQFEKCVETFSDMSQDGLIPRVTSTGIDNRNVPLLGIVICGVICGVSAMIFNLTTLCQLLSISFILVNTISVLVVLALRYRPTEESANEAERRRKVQRRRRKSARLARNHFTNDSSSTSYGSTITPQSEASMTVNDIVELDDHSSTSQDPSLINPSSYSNPSTPESLSSSINNNNDNDVELLGINQSLTKQDNHSTLVDNGSSSDSDVDHVVEEYRYTVCMRVISEQRATDIHPKIPTLRSYRKSLMALLGYLVSCIGMACLLLRGQNFLKHGNIIAIVFTVLFLLAFLLCFVTAVRQPIDTVECAFLLIKVPGMPWLPLASILANICLAVAIDIIPWIQTLVWLLTGSVLYLVYGIRHSNEARVQEHRPAEQRGLLPPLPNRHRFSAKMINTVTGQNYNILHDDVEEDMILEH